MNKEDREVLSQLQAMFKEDAENISLPASLSADSIRSRLAQTEQDNVVPMKAGRSNGSAAGRIAAFAACFILMLGVAVVARNVFGSKDAGIRSAFESFKIDNLLKKIGSGEELDSAVSEIMESSGGSSSAQPSSQTAAGGKTEGEAQGAVSVTVDDSSNTAGVVNDRAKQADIVKYSGGYLYVLTSAIDEKTSLPTQVIRIISASTDGGMKEISAITLPVGRESECFEIYVSGSTLAALVSFADYTPSSLSAKRSTVALYYDISDPASPALRTEQKQSGAYVSSSLEGGTLYLVTGEALTAENAGASLEINGRKQTPGAESGEIIAAENAKEKYYLFISAAEIPGGGEEISKLEVLGCSANSEIYICEKSIYITRQISAVDTGEKRTEIYGIAYENGRLAPAGTYSFDGSLSAGLNITAKEITYIYSGADSLYYGALTPELKKENEDVRLDIPADSAVRFIGSTAYISASGGGKKVTYADGEVTVTDSGTLPAGEDMYRLTDSKLLGIGKPDGSGMVGISLYGSDGKLISSYTMNIENSVPVVSDTRAILIDSEKEIFGIPVIITESRSEKSAYVLFDAHSGIEPVGIFMHDSFSGDAATRAVTAGGELYTVSGSKIAVFSLEDGKALRTYYY